MTAISMPWDNPKAIEAAVEAFRASPHMRDRTAIMAAVERVYDRLTEADLYALAVLEHCIALARGPGKISPRKWLDRVDHQGVRDITCVSAKEADELLRCVTSDLDPLLRDVLDYVLGTWTVTRPAAITARDLAKALRPDANPQQRNAYLDGLTVAIIKFARMRIRGFLRWRGPDFAQRLANAVEDRLDHSVASSSKAQIAHKRPAKSRS